MATLGTTPPEAATPTGPGEARLRELLVRTSRTFALSIPLLGEPTRREVMVSYLMFRVADTFEDADLWPPDWRVRALRDFGGLLGNPSLREARRLSAGWSAPPPCDHAGYRELIAEVPLVLREYRDLGRPAREVVRRHALRTVERMAGFAGRCDTRGALRLRDLADLRDYCYAVAGIVGELLTDLFQLAQPELSCVAGYLQARAPRFGEALQLVNILKDSREDERKSRFFLPDTLDRGQVLALARRDLEAASEYVRALQEAGGPPGTVACVALPLLLARATLDLMERHGPGAKLTRGEVAAISGGLLEALRSGAPAIRE